MKDMKEFTKQEKGGLIFSSGCYLTDENGFDVNDELMKQIGVLEACVNCEHHVPKQLFPLNELKEHLRKFENVPIHSTLTPNFLGYHNISEMMLNEIGKFVIDFPEEVEFIKSQMK